MRTHGFASSVVTHRDLSPPIALKRKFLAVDLTVSPACSDKKWRIFSCLYVLETIEWE